VPVELVFFTFLKHYLDNKFSLNRIQFFRFDILTLSKELLLRNPISLLCFLSDSSSIALRTAMIDFRNTGY